MAFRKEVVFLLMFMFMFSFALVDAKDPKTSTGENNLEIKFPSHYIVKVGEGFEFAFHISSQETGLALTSSDTFFCDYHLYNPEGEHIMTQRKTQANLEHDYDLEFKPDANNFTEIGDYYYNIYCECDDCSIISDFDDLGGFARVDIVATTTGGEVSEAQATLYLSMLLFVIFLFSLIIIVHERLPRDVRNDDGYIMDVSQLAYLRPVLKGMAWIMLTSLVYIGANMGVAYLWDGMMGDYLFMCFTLLLISNFVIIPICIIHMIQRIALSKEMKGMIERGVDFK